MPFPFQVAGFWTGAMRKYEGFGTAYAHKQTESGDPTDGGWINLSEQRWLNSGERHRRRVLAAHYRAERRDLGPLWLTLLGHTKDSLWSLDLFRTDSILR